MSDFALCFINGALVPFSDARVSVQDLGLARGFGIYEGLTAFRGEPFRFDDHWKRFSLSARALGLAVPVSRADALEAMRALAAHNAPGKRVNVRMVLTGGIAEGGIAHVPGRETLFITAEPAQALPVALYERGGMLIRREHRRFMPEIKTTNYIFAVLAQRARVEAGAIEILYTDRERVLECATSNVFAVKNGVLLTPKADVLPGITRLVALEIAAKAGIACEVREVSLGEFLGADEAFITSSFKDIVPIVALDSARLGTGAPGPITNELMRRFQEYATA